MKVRELFLICLVALCLVPENLFADDTLIAESGHNVYPISSGDIRMVSEKVTLRRDERQGGILADCLFAFENVSEEAIRAKVGFPGNVFSSESGRDDMLEDFMARVDGAERAVEVRKEVLEEYSEGETEYRHWYTWDAEFPPGKEVKIINTYFQPLSEDLQSRWFDYVLVTAANWNGSIGSAVIEVLYQDEATLRSRVKSLRPEGYRIEGNRIVWKFKDLVPSEDIRVVEINTDNKDMLIEDVMKFALRGTAYGGSKRQYSKGDVELAEHGEAWERLKSYSSEYTGIFADDRAFTDEARKAFARVKRNEIFARHGRVFEAQDLRGIFGATEWYSPDPGYSDVLLNDIERENVWFIMDYERRMGWR